MAKQVQQSGLAGKLGKAAQARWEENKAKVPEPDSGSRLPAGINNGVAQLRTCGFKIMQTGKHPGEYGFTATARVCEPAEVNGVPVRGMITRIVTIPICDTPERINSSTKQPMTQADHFDRAREVLARLHGGPLDEYGPSEVEALAAALEEAKPFFRFRTWAGNKQELVQRAGKWYVTTGRVGGDKGPYASEAAAKQANPYVGQEPMVNETWGDLVPDYVPPEESGVVDDSGGDSSGATEVDGSPATEEGNEGADEETVDLRELVEAAERNDAEDEECNAAQDAIISRAKPLGIDTDKYDTWGEVVDLIEAAEGGGEGGDDAPADDVVEWEPIKGMTIEAKIKGAKKPVKIKVTSIDADAQTVNGQRLDTKAVVKGIAWTALVHD